MPSNTFFSGLSLGTSNPNKVAEYSEILGTPVPHVLLTLPEPRLIKTDWKCMADGEYEKIAARIASEKALHGYSLNGRRPVLVEATLLFIHRLDGFPGPFIGDLDADECRDMLTRFTAEEGRQPKNQRATAIVTLAVSSRAGMQVRHGRVEGDISIRPAGDNGFGWDSIFDPHDGTGTATFAEMLRSQKNLISMRRMAVEAVRAQPFTIRPDEIG